MRLLRPSPFGRALARIEAAFWPSQPGETIPAGSPGLVMAPIESGPDRTVPRAFCGGRSLRAALAEGAFAEIFSAYATGAVITGWAIYLGAGPAIIGFIGALPLAAQVANLPAAWMTSRRRRKTVTVTAVGLSRLAFLPLIALPFLAAPQGVKRSLFVLVVAVSTIFGVVGNNAWAAWMGDFVPRRIRGRFFGRRTIYATLTGTLATLSAAFLLDRAAKAGWTGQALAALTVFGCTAGLAGIGLLLCQGEHRPRGAGPPAPGLLRRALADRRVRPLLSYQVSWNAAVAISASFFAYHLLTNLKTGFLVVAGHGIIVATVRISSAGLWGRAVDNVGARAVLTVCSFGISLSPLIWFAVTPERLWPIACEASLSGFLWAGHAIAATALPLGLATKETRPLYLAAFASAGGVGYAVASFLAGQLATALPAHFAVAGRGFTAMHVLFLLSALGRFAAATLAPKLPDPGAKGTVRDVVRVFARRERACA